MPLIHDDERSVFTSVSILNENEIDESVDDDYRVFPIRKNHPPFRVVIPL